MSDLANDLEVIWVDTEDIGSSGEAWVEFRGRNNSTSLPAGLPGPVGDDGLDAPDFRWLGMVASAGDLPSSGADGDGFIVLDAMRVWVRRSGRWLDAGRLIGPKGVRGDDRAYDPTALFATLPPGSTASVRVIRNSSVNLTESPAGSRLYTIPSGFVGATGLFEVDAGLVESEDTPGLYSFGATGSGLESLEFRIPRGPRGPVGVQGAPGPAAALLSSLDFDENRPLVLGDTLAWNASTSRWQPSTLLPSLVGPWHFPNGSGWVAAVSNATGASRLLGTFTVPAQLFPWRPWVFGAVAARGRGGTFSVAVNLGSTSGPTVAKLDGFGTTGAMAAFPVAPSFSGAEMHGADTSTGVVAAGQVATFTVSLVRASGSSNHDYSPVPSFLTVFALPV
ncbi:hypothetical protein [Rhodococcus sp. RS1C4]|nr:hypothetical protein [Rhodococcus sp. RS1C4]